MRPLLKAIFRPRIALLLGGLAIAALSAHAQTPVVRQLRNTGPNASRLNIAILGDGYTAAQQERFFADAQRKIDLLVANEALAPARDLINGVAIFTASNESGTDVGTATLRDTYYDTGFAGTVNSRLLTIVTNAGRTRAQTILREHAPDYDISVMLVNTTDYGGAGGSPAVTSLHASSDEILLHEIGHSFARLTDEYVDLASAPSYPPAEYPNATQKTARAEIPWRDFLAASLAIPTTEATSDADLVGFWEGAHFRATGFYRPAYDSKMRSLGRPWGPVNLRAFAAALHRANLNAATAAPGNLALRASAARVTGGAGVSLTASADGVGPLTYQWSLNGTFLPGATTATLTLPSLSSTDVGAYSVEVTNAAGSVASAATGVIAQVAAQGAAFEIQVVMLPSVRWVQSALMVGEQSGSAVLTVGRSGNTTAALTVNYATAPGTAASPADFAAQTGTIAWAAGDTGDKTIRIPVVADEANEGTETFTVTLSNPSAGIIAGGATATVAIADPGVRDPAFATKFINNPVNRVLPLPDGSVLVAGYFTSVRDAASVDHAFGRIARLKADGALDLGFNPGRGADGIILALARQPDGKILIGGDFLNYDGTGRARIARLNADGSLDRSFTPVGCNQIVFDTLVLPDGKILLAGAFTMIDGIGREYLARLHPDGSLDTTFTGPDFGSTMAFRTRSLALQADGRVLVGGGFYFDGGVLRAGVCRLEPDGRLDPSFNGVVQGATTGFTGLGIGEVRQVVPQPDGKILIGGDVVSFNDVARRGIARLTSTGAIDAAFNPGSGTDGPVDALLLQGDGKIIIGGRFTTFNGVAASNLARLHADGSLDRSFAAGGPGNSVATLALQADGHLLFGGGVAALQNGPGLQPIWRVLVGAPAVAAPGLPATPATPQAIERGRLINLSIRTELSSGTDSFTLGFVLSGAGTSATKPLLVRAAGPSLAVFDVPTPLADPALDLYAGAAKIGENDNWSGAEPVRAMITQVGAFPFASAASRDAALALPAIGSGAHSAVVSGTGAGTVIAEVYDATPAAAFGPSTPRLINVSVRKHLGNGVTPVIAGFVIGGTTPCTVLIRAIGPTLGSFGVVDAAANPQLGLLSGGVPLHSNNDWNGDAGLREAFAQVGAFPLPNDSKDAALIARLAPGNYTVNVNTATPPSGVALIEIYEVP